MPYYAYHCDRCDNGFDKKLPISEYNAPQVCPECGEGPARKLISQVGVVFKGDGWASKNNRIAGQMRKKNQHLTHKQKERQHEAGIKLVPNVGGEKTESWSDAAKLAKSKGKDSSGYSKRASSEKKS